jgi:serine/threonine protein kinase
MSAVYRAAQPSMKREVAIKILSPMLASEAGYAQRFEREARTVGTLEHPHIVPLYDNGTQTINGNIISYVAMQLLTGGTLSQRLQFTRQSTQALPSLLEIAEIMRQLASALDYAHARGVVHRDIKPSNVMFDEQGKAFLVDFGIAKLIDATSVITTTGSTLGTPSYMSPEQWMGEEIVPSTDQYALGVMIYEMLTGHLPFKGDHPYRLMKMHVDDAPTPLRFYRANLHDDVEDVVFKAMSKKPNLRFASVSALAQAFDEAISDEDKDETTGFFVKTLPTRIHVPKLPVVTPAENPTKTPQAGVVPDGKTRRSQTAPKVATARKARTSRVLLLVLLIAITTIGLLAINNANSLFPQQAENDTTDSADTPTAAGAAPRFDTVNLVVNAEANLRSEPGTNAAILNVVTRGTETRALARNGFGSNAWYLIEYQEEYGWISGRVTALTPNDGQVPEVSFEADDIEIVAHSPLAGRELSPNETVIVTVFYHLVSAEEGVLEVALQRYMDADCTVQENEDSVARETTVNQRSGVVEVELANALTEGRYGGIFVALDFSTDTGESELRNSPAEYCYPLGR